MARRPTTPSTPTRTRTRQLTGPGSSTPVTVSVLDGGLSIITETVPTSRSVSFGIWVGVGSVDEIPRLAGVSHFLEHLLFKGTARASGAEISARIDAVGGELNAFTSHEATCYYAHVLAADAELAIDTVCDVVLRARLSTADVNTERQVVLEELAMREDDPESLAHEAFNASLYAGHPLADPVIGNEKSVSALTRTQIAGYYRRRYHPANMVVAVAGAIEHTAVMRWVRRAFAGHLVTGQQPVRPGRPRRKPHQRTRLQLTSRDVEQAHLLVGGLSVPHGDPRYPVMSVLTCVLGGGMSSRLFQRIREERGLAYSCYANHGGYADTGGFSVYAGCHPKHLAEVAALVRAELQAVRSGVGREELSRAQGQLVGSAVLALEDNESKMVRLGRNLLLRGQFRPLSTDLADIRAVTPAQVQQMAEQLFHGPLTTSVLGPYRRVRDVPIDTMCL